MRRTVNVLLVVVFLGIIALPLGANLAGRDGGDAQAENRALAEWPAFAWSWESISAFPSQASLWFEDHFGFRSTLVRWYSLSRYEGLGISPSALVVKGKDGWLYYAEDGSLEDYTRHHPMTVKQLANWRAYIRKAQAWCESIGVAYFFVSPPDKPLIYPEHYSDDIRRVGNMTRLDQLMSDTRDTGVVVDVRPAIEAGKRLERLYHRTDTHWNQRGAFLAYQELINAIRARVPAVPPPWERSDFEAATRELPGQDLAGMLGLKRVMTEEDLRLLPIRKRTYVVVEPKGSYATSGEARIVTEIPGSNLPTAVMFRDSFTSWLAPFISEHFSRIVYLWQDDFDANVIRAEKPDVVIQEIVSRHLYTFIPSPELIPDP